MNETKEILKLVRKHTGLTQKQFAEAVGLKQSAYSMIESGTNKPSIDLLRLIADKFEINPIVFFSDADEHTINDILTTKNVDLNVGKRVDLNVGSSATNLKELEKKRFEDFNNKWEQAREKANETLTDYYNNNPIGIKSRKLQELKESYGKRLKRELQHNNKPLFDTLQLAENTDAAFELLGDIGANYINNHPNPFDASLYFDLQNNTENIPDTIDYKTYKEDVINWLSNIQKYHEAIAHFYSEIDKFLKEIKPLDEHGII